MGTYSWIKGKWVDKETGEPLNNDKNHNWWEYGAPQILREIQPYLSPIDQRPIETRVERREDMKKHGCREYEPNRSTPFEDARDRLRKKMRDSKQT